MKILYKPFAIIASMIAARIGRGVFKAIWTKIDSADPPEPTTEQASLPRGRRRRRPRGGHDGRRRARPWTGPAPGRSST